MNQATIGQRTYEVAGRFSELKPAQFIDVVGLLHAGLDKRELKLRLTMILLEVQARPLFYRDFHRMSNESRHELTALAAFCLAEPKLTKQLLPELRVPGLRRKKLYGPSDAFGNLSFAEFIEAEGHFAAYPAKPAALDQLVATLYRPAGGDDPADVRQAYSPHDVAERTALVARLPAATRLAVRMWYASCRAAWVQKYTGTLFTTSTEPAGQPPRDPRETWREILAERAGSPVNYEEYGLVPLPNVLFDLDLRIRKYQADQEAQQNKR